MCFGLVVVMLLRLMREWIRGSEGHRGESEDGKEFHVEYEMNLFEEKLRGFAVTMEDRESQRATSERTHYLYSHSGAVRLSKHGLMHHPRLLQPCTISRCIPSARYLLPPPVRLGYDAKVV